MWCKNCRRETEKEKCELCRAETEQETPAYRTFQNNHARNLKDLNTPVYIRFKASTIESSVSGIIQEGRLLLGTWQGIYFAEFDPPRSRSFYVKVI
jgi:secondary thiamine-phosphate synthase enzyme